MREALTAQTATAAAHTTTRMQDAQRTLTLPRTHDETDRTAHPPSTLLPAAESWSALLAASSAGWCAYPSYRSSFVFDSARYERDYMPPNQTCATRHRAQPDRDRLGALASASNPDESSLGIPFEVRVDPRGMLHISGCVGGRLSYSLEHDKGPTGSAGIRPQEGGWAPSLASLQSLGEARPQSVMLPYPASFVFVWCDSPAATAGSSTPAFLPVHTPVPEEILRKRPAPRRRVNAQANGNNDSGSGTILRRNLIILELDALSAKMLPLLMPRTYALLESMRQPTGEHDDAGVEAEEAQAAARPAASLSSVPSSFVSAAPSHTVSYRFTRTSLSGTNSVPSFLSLFGGGSYAAQPAPDSPEWLWNAARSAGFTTGFGENCCSFGKYAVAGLDERSLPPRGTVPRMDYNALLPVCHLPPFPAAGWTVEEGPRCVGEQPTWQVTLEPMRLALARQSDAALSLLAAGSADSLSSHPLFYSQVLMEAHESSGFLARHMDDSGFAETLAEMLASPAMQQGLMLLYSDHGLHYGTYSFASAHGQQEHLEPFLYLLAPKHGAGALTPHEQRMLRLNAHRLTSPFDWHKTLLALIRGGEDRDERGDTQSAEAADAPSVSSAFVARSYNLLRDRVPTDRSCEQLPHVPLDDFWNPSRKMTPLCLCESPFSRVCRTRPIDLAPSIWNECTQLWGHPLVFDATFYARMHRRGIQIDEQLQQGGVGSTAPDLDAATPPGVDFSPCVSLHHWCTRGVYLGLQSSASFHLRALMTFHPSLAVHLADPLSFLRRFVVETHEMQPTPRTMFPPPTGQIQPLIDLLPTPPSHFAAFAGVSLTATQVALQDELRAACGEPHDPGAQVWLRAITMQSKCEETTEAAAAATDAAPTSDSHSRLSPLESAALVADARWQCGHWCMFDLASASASNPDAIAGWEVTGAACLQRFDSGSRSGRDCSVCVTQFAALKAESLQLKNEANAAQSGA